MDFLARLEPIITDQLYIGSLADEIKQNTWFISASTEERSAITVDDLEKFIAAIIDNRRKQVEASNQASGMLFYMWFDMQASQLRFSLISDVHQQLPFGAKLNIVSNPRSIIEAFLSSQPEILWGDLEVEAFSETELPSETPEFILDVYVTQLAK